MTKSTSSQGPCGFDTHSATVRPEQRDQSPPLGITSATPMEPTFGHITDIKTRILKQIAWAGAEDAVTHEAIEGVLKDALRDAFKAGCDWERQIHVKA